MVAVTVCLIACSASARDRHSSPALDLLDAARIADAHMSVDQGFTIKANVRLEEINGIEKDGSYSLSWASPTRWREEFAFPDFHQVRIGAPGGVWEERVPKFLSFRIWQLIQALGYYGRFKLQQEESAGKVKEIKKRGRFSLY